MQSFFPTFNLRNNKLETRSGKQKVTDEVLTQSRVGVNSEQIIYTQTVQKSKTNLFIKKNFYFSFNEL